MTEVAETIATEGKKQEAVRIASEMFRQSPDWITFFREVLGVGGVARRLFASQEEMTEFELSEEYREIQTMVAKLREKGGDLDVSKEPTRVITVRLPKSLHESLRAEAHDRHTSMNQLCISKLLQVIEAEMVPSDNRSSEKKPKESITINRMAALPPTNNHGSHGAHATHPTQTTPANGDFRQDH
jgi:predicted HicB family RNase H-like nuclease